MKGLDPMEVETLEDACIVLDEYERTFDDEGYAAMDPVEQAAADRVKVRGLVVEDDVSGCLDITPRGRLALQCHYALVALSGSVKP